MEGNRRQGYQPAEEVEERLFIEFGAVIADVRRVHPDPLAVDKGPGFARGPADRQVFPDSEFWFHTPKMGNGRDGARQARGWRWAAEEAPRIVGEGPAYFSFDIDTLDPAYAPGTGRRSRAASRRSKPSA